MFLQFLFISILLFNEKKATVSHIVTKGNKMINSICLIDSVRNTRHKQLQVLNNNAQGIQTIYKG